MVLDARCSRKWVVGGLYRRTPQKVKCEDRDIWMGKKAAERAAKNPGTGGMLGAGPPMSGGLWLSAGILVDIPEGPEDRPGLSPGD